MDSGYVKRSQITFEKTFSGWPPSIKPSLVIPIVHVTCALNNLPYEFEFEFEVTLQVPFFSHVMFVLCTLNFQNLFF